jgi:hypothetical protein
VFSAGKENSDPQNQAKWPIGRLSFSGASPQVGKPVSKKRLAEDSLNVTNKQDKQTEGPLAKKPKRGLAQRSVNGQATKEDKFLPPKPFVLKPVIANSLLVLDDSAKTHSNDKTTEHDQPAIRRQDAAAKRLPSISHSDVTSKRTDSLTARVQQQQPKLHNFKDVPPQVFFFTHTTHKHHLLFIQRTSGGFHAACDNLMLLHPV